MLLRRHFSHTLPLIAALAFLPGCQKGNEFKAPPPPKVTVAEPISRDVVETVEFTGTTEATATVELRARVSGYLEKIVFQDGAFVKKGDLLFVIEQAPFQAELDAAKADLQKAEATLQLAEANLKRTRKLAQENATTQQQLDVQQAEQATAAAGIESGRVAVEQAQLNYGYTEIRAPISGRIGRRLVDEGNLIRLGDMPLAVIQSIDPIYANFYLSEPELLRFMNMQRENQLPDPQQTPPVLHIGLRNEEGFPHEGHLDYRELGLSPSTGTILRRGIFPNPDNQLVPGLFVKIRVQIGESKPRLLVEERALGSDQRGDFLLVVNKEKVVEYRPVKLGIAMGPLRVIEDGIQAGDLVVVNGLQKARPGSPVDPQREKAEPEKPAEQVAQGSSSTL